MAVTGTALATSLIFNGLIALACFMIFSVLRKHAITKKFYSPKRFNSSRKKKPKRMPTGFLSWIPFILRYEEADVIDVCGLDTAVFLRYLKYGVVLFTCVTLWVFATVVPVNATGKFLSTATLGDPVPLCANGERAKCAGVAGGNDLPEATCMKPKRLDLSWENCQRPELMNRTVVLSCSAGSTVFCQDQSTAVCSMDASPEYSDLDIISLSNVGPKSHRMWMHLVSTYIISILAMKLLWTFSHDVTELRVKFLATLPRGGQTYSVLVTDIPGIPYGTIAHKLHGLLDGTLGRLLPNFIKQRIEAAYQSMSSVSMSLPERAGKGVEQPKGAAGSKEGEVESYHSMSQVVDDSPLKDNWQTIQQKLLSGETVNGVVSEEMRAVYGASNFAAANAVYNQDTLTPMVAKYEGMVRQLEDLVDAYMGKVRRRMTVKKRHQTTVIGPLWGSWAVQKYGNAPTKVDTLHFLPEALRHMKLEITREQEKARAGMPLPAAFVTFQNRLTACQATSGLHCHTESFWAIHDSPSAEEVVWENLSMRSWERAIRTTIIWAAFVAIVIFYLPVVAAIQLPVNIENARKIQGLKVLVDLPVVSQIIQGILPSIVMIIFLALLPSLLTYMSRKQGLVSISQIDRAVVVKYFIFLFFALFVYVFLAGTALSQLRNIIDDPSTIINLLGVAAPQQAAFFMTFILLSGLSAAPIGLLRIVGVILFWVFSKMATTPKAKRRLWADQEMRFGPYIPGHGIVLMLGLVFSCINPLIAPVTLLYFIIVSIVERYQMIYVYDHGYEAGGKLWREIFGQVMTAIYTFQVLMACLLGIKKFVYTPIIIPLPILTYMFHRGVLSALIRPWSLMSTQEAAFLDHLDAERRNKDGLPPGFTTDELSAVSTEYLAPVMKVSEVELEELLGQATMVDEALSTLEKGRPAGDVEEPELLGKVGTSGQISEQESEDNEDDVPAKGKDVAPAHGKDVVPEHGRDVVPEHGKA